MLANVVPVPAGPVRSVAVEVRAAYRFRSLTGDPARRWTGFEAELPLLSDENAPVAMTVDDGEKRIDYRVHGGRLYRPFERDLRIADGPASPILLANDREFDWFEPLSSPPPETDEVAAIAVESRARCIEEARAFLAQILIGPNGRGELVEMRPVSEPLLAVVPPGDTFDGFSGRRGGRNKLGAVKVILDPLRHRGRPEFVAALREDRLFLPDEIEDAFARAAEYAGRAHRGRLRVEIRDRSCFSLDISTPALRQTAKAAIEASDALRRSDLRAVRSDLKIAVLDEGANAAAMSPQVRSFLAAFQSSRSIAARAAEPEMAKALDRLSRAHDRAQKRMAACRIPDRDVRQIAAEDDLALGRLSW